MGEVLWDQSDEEQKVVSPATSYVTGAALTNLKASIKGELTPGEQVVPAGVDRNFKTQVTALSGSVAFRGTAPSGPGFWFAPTVLAPGGVDSAAFREEIFGPGAARRPGRRIRQPLGQLPFFGSLFDAIRRVQAIGTGPGTRAGRARRLHRDQERVHLDGGNQYLRDRKD